MFTVKPPCWKQIDHSHPLVRGLVLCLPFNEGTGNKLHDLSRNGNHGTINGALWTPGMDGHALSFDGDDYIACSDSPGLDITDAITLSACIKMNTLGNHSYVIDKYYDGSKRSYLLWARAGGELRVVLGNTTGSAAQLDEETTNLDMSADVWYHVGATWDKAIGNIRFYKNGQLIETLGSGGTQSMAANTQPLRIGTNYVFADYFAGSISDVCIYNRALSIEEMGWLHREPYAMFH